jgi:hypothetical protein
MAGAAKNAIDSKSAPIDIAAACVPRPLLSIAALNLLIVSLASAVAADI